MLAAALAFSSGALFATYTWRPPLWWLTATVVLLASAAWCARSRPRAARALALTALAALGALRLEGKNPRPDRARLEGWTDGRESLVTARVTRSFAPRESAWGGARQRLEVETERIESEGAAEEVRLGVRLTLYEPRRRGDDEDGEEDSAALPSLEYGERIRFPARLRLPRNFGNPGNFDYRGYLAREGIVLLGSVRADRIELLPGFAGSRWEAWRSRARRSLNQRMHALWPEREASLMAAMLVGERTELGRDLRLDFQRTGTYHILVVSGLNLGILAWLVFWTMRRLRASELATSVITLLVVSAYAYLTDAGPPVLRATLMLAVYLGARWLYRERAPLNAVGAAALVLLVADPQSLFDPSFQLTFLAVLAIAGIALPVVERTSLPYRRALAQLDSTEYDARLAPRLAQFRLDLRLLASRLARFAGERLARWTLVLGGRMALGLFDVLLLAAVMQVALALPMAIYFHRAVLVALPANAVIVPLTGVLMPAAIAAMALSYVWLPLARLPAMTADWALKGITGVVAWMGAARGTEVRLPTPEPEMMLLAAASFALAMLAVRRRAVVAAAGLTALAASALALVVVPPEPQIRHGALEVTLLDVGQGDAILVVTPEGRTLLVDAGGSLGGENSDFDFGEDVVSPYLWRRGLARLDAVALTHAHADHIGGLASVLANFRPRELWLGPNPPIAALERLQARARSLGVRMVERREGERFTFGGTEIEVMAPPFGWKAGERPRNNDSLALYLRFGETAVLLPGDAERRIERHLVEHLPRADLLKVAHHGSATSTTPELLAAVQPHYAAISVGFRSPFGHPKPEVLERLASRGVRTYRTDMHGAVTFYLDGRMVTPEGDRR